MCGAMVKTWPFNLSTILAVDEINCQTAVSCVGYAWVKGCKTFERSQFAGF